LGEGSKKKVSKRVEGLRELVLRGTVGGGVIREKGGTLMCRGVFHRGELGKPRHLRGKPAKEKFMGQGGSNLLNRKKEKKKKKKKKKNQKKKKKHVCVEKQTRQKNTKRKNPPKKRKGVHASVKWGTGVFEETLKSMKTVHSKEINHVKSGKRDPTSQRGRGQREGPEKKPGLGVTSAHKGL